MEYTIKVTTTGSAGSATGTATSDDPIEGLILGVKVDYNAIAPGTTALTITEVGGLAQTILSLTASNVDKVRYPQNALHDTSGATTGSYGPIYVSKHQVTVAVTACDALTDAVIVTLEVLKGN